MNGSLFKMWDFSKIVTGAKNSMNLVVKAIPIYKQVTPVVSNIRSAFNSVNSLKKASKDALIKDIKSFERPQTIYKKKSISNERGKIDFNTLRFFK